MRTSIVTAWTAANPFSMTYRPNRLHACTKSRTALLDLSCGNLGESMLHCCSKSCTGFRWNSEFDTRLLALQQVVLAATLKDHSLHRCPRLLEPISRLVLCILSRKAYEKPQNRSQNCRSVLVNYLCSWPPVSGTRCLLIWESLPRLPAFDLFWKLTCSLSSSF